MVARIALTLATVICIAPFAVAQERPPALLVQPPGQQSSQPVQLQKLEIESRIHGFLAETALTMTFFNPHPRPLEGQLVFPLPDGATVSGYALDVNGALVDGVAIEKERAQVVFEKEVRRGVDPGLVEWTQGNNFRTRIYPLPPNGTRTVRVRYVSELAAVAGGQRYLLPVVTGDALEQLALRIEVVDAAAAPRVQFAGPALAFKRVGSSQLAELVVPKARLAAQLALDLPSGSGPQLLVEENPDGQVMFCVHAAVADPRSAAERRAIAPSRLTLLWDASRSRADVDHTRELQLIQQYLGRQQQKVAVDLVLFHVAVEPARRFVVERGDASALLQALRETIYDGGTQLGAIAPTADSQPPDLYLLFSDGLSNLGQELAQGFKAPLYAFTVGAGGNGALLDQIARASGGQRIDLDRSGLPAALDAIGVAAYAFLGAEVAAVEAGNLYPRAATPVQGAFSLSGQLRGARASINVRYGAAGKVLREDKVVVERSKAARGTLLTRFWAQQQLTELLVSPQRNHEAMLALGKHHGLVTPVTSLIVLESLEQYVRNQIEPPASLPALQQQYRALVAQQRALDEQQKQEKLQHIVELWQQRVQWWESTFTYPKNFRFTEHEAKKSMSMDESRAERPMARPAPTTAVPDAEPGAPAERRAEAKDKKKGDAAGPAAGPEAAISLAPWQPDTPYLRAIAALPVGERYRAYLKQRALHGTAPAFFLDCADLFYRDQQPALALRVLSNIAEIELENAPLLRVLAHRLAQLGQRELAAQAFDDVLRLRPEEPQSYRDLALVLGDLEQYQRAMELLVHVVMNHWDRFDEIEVIALMELNRMLPRARQKGVAEPAIDRRLIKNLDVDTRIVMTWDADLTDLDLWVIEPSGEKAYYGHNRTTIGGLVSRDFTQGYGPEEYVLRRAMNGEYTVQTNFYGSSAQSLIGAVTLQLDIYTNYGRPNERKKSVTLRLTEKKETFTVGTIEF